MGLIVNYLKNHESKRCDFPLVVLSLVKKIGDVLLAEALHKALLYGDEVLRKLQFGLL